MHYQQNSRIALNSLNRTIMTLWQDHDENSIPDAMATMLDAVFRIDCQCLPVDHAAQVSSAITAHVPWLQELPRAGIHPIHVAGSQNGWERPDASSGEDLLLSKRTRLRIRIDSEHSERLITDLSGLIVAFDRYQLSIKSGERKLLTPSSTLLSRYTYFDNPSDDENEFVQQIVDACKRLRYTPTKVMCGRQQTLSTDSEPVTSRSVLLADVPAAMSIRLQEAGLGELRGLGCGLLIPHKDTRAVHSMD